MHASLLFRRLALVVLLLAGVHATGRSQGPPRGELLVFRVPGLTSAMRDALVRELSDDRDLRVVHACVPAGLIAFQAEREGLQPRAASLLTRPGARDRAERTTMDIQALEQACSQVRGQ